MIKMINYNDFATSKPERKRVHGIPSRSLEDDIKMDCKETLCEDMDWIQLSECRVH